MIDQNLLIAIEKEYQDYIGQKSDTTQGHYMYWFSKFPHPQFLEALDQGSEEAQQVIKGFLFRVRDREKRTRWDNSVCRGFLLSYLKCLELHKKIEIPESRWMRKKRRIKPALSKGEIAEMGRVLKTKFKFKYWFAFNLLYHGALRKSEINPIRFNSFQWERWFDDPDEDCYLIVRGKGDKEREVLIPANIILSLVDYLLNKMSPKWDYGDIRCLSSDDRLLFKFGKNSLYKNIIRAGQIALHKNVNPHLIRHTKASHLLDMGAEIKDIQNYLGHSNLATTEIYLHRSQKQSLENIKKLKNKFSLKHNGLLKSE